MHDTHGPDALFVDLYEMTMAQAYLQSGQSGQATFSLYFRNFPSDRAYYVFCGLESAVGYLESLSFSEMDIDTLERMGLFDDALLEYLRSFRFSGSVRAMAEGEVFFPNEPVLEVTGPIIECQIAETFLLNQINLESMLATKAARVVDAAAGRSVVDFGARRTHGLDAATKFARASYIVGFDGTSNVRAASMYGIPAVGTMAHSYISSFDSELDAFASYAKSFPETSTFLVDTYETIGGVRNAIAVAREMAANGHSLRAVRLDSGDIDTLARQAREMLDGADLAHVLILASGGLDEYSIDALVRAGAPLDGFGVGTRVGTSADAPYTDFVYKLVEYDGAPMMKFSTDKESLPGPKQVVRFLDSEGRIRRDLIEVDQPSETYQDGEPLLSPVMVDGARLSPPRIIGAIRDSHRSRIDLLPNGLRGVRPSGTVEAQISPRLQSLADRLHPRVRNSSEGQSR